MKIRNLTAKPIGFGSVVILPDQAGDTPKGYGKDHPTVKYYLSRRWIEEVGAAGSGAAADNTGGLSVNVNAGGGSGTGSEGEDDGENNDTGGDNSGGSGDAGDTSNTGAATENKSIDRMNKDELQALAFAQGIVFAETDTRQVLIDKIKAAKNAEA